MNAGTMRATVCPAWVRASVERSERWECVTLEPGGDLRVWCEESTEARARAWWADAGVAAVRARGAMVGVRRVVSVVEFGPSHPVTR